jgi:hypothetical protein
MRETIDEFVEDGCQIVIGFDTGGPFGAHEFASVRPQSEDEDWVVTRWFYFDEFDENYAKNFGRKVATDDDYRERSLNGTADWKQVVDIYNEVERRILAIFNESPSQILAGYSSGDDDEKRRYKAAEQSAKEILSELFSEIRSQVRSDDPLEIDALVENKVAEAREAVQTIDPRTVPDLSRGDFVVDIEQNDEDATGVVLDVLNEEISEHFVTDAETVHDFNEEYPPDQPVIVIVFRDQLEDTEWEPDMNIEQTKEVVEDTDWLNTYSYPAGRLQLFN